MFTQARGEQALSSGLLICWSHVAVAGTRRTATVNRRRLSMFCNAGTWCLLFIPGVPCTFWRRRFRTTTPPAVLFAVVDAFSLYRSPPDGVVFACASPRCLYSLFLFISSYLFSGCVILERGVAIHRCCSRAVMAATFHLSFRAGGELCLMGAAALPFIRVFLAVFFSVLRVAVNI